MEKVRFGLIGCGNIAQGHTKNFETGKIKDGVITAICDIKPEKYEALNAAYGNKFATFTDAKEMLASGLIDAVIICERDTHKAIIIGKQGSMIKEIGSRARREIEFLLGEKVYLDLWVKVNEDWRNKENAIKSMLFHIVFNETNLFHLNDNDTFCCERVFWIISK